jgi:enamidase
MVGQATAVKTLIVNCNRIVSGDLSHPFAEGDSILVSSGQVEAIGERAALLGESPTTIVNANGQTAVPGLIDTHIHPSWGDWTGRMNAQGWLAAYGQAGITTLISHGAFNIDGYPADAAGMVALGITLARSFARDWRPGGVKVIGATISLVDGLLDDDFAVMAREGVSLISEIGVRSIADPVGVREMLQTAHKHGFISRVHFGPASIAGSHSIDAAAAFQMGGHIIAHVNGGPTSASQEDVDFIFDNTRCALELNYSGNLRMLLHVARRARDSGTLERLMIGTDTPSGTGIAPRAIARACAWLSSILDIPPELALAIASGNAANAYRLNRGKLAPGREADILLMDAPKDSSATDALDALRIGDIPAVGMLMVDGAIVSLQCRNTPPPKHVAAVSPV